MEMEVYFPGKKRVYARYNGHLVESDQPAHAGGDGSAPSPFELFLTSIATCAGFFALDFMQQRDIPTDQAKLTFESVRDPDTKLVGTVKMNLDLPPGFPVKYTEAIVRAMDLCTVKRHLERPPKFEVTASPGVEGR